MTCYFGSCILARMGTTHVRVGKEVWAALKIASVRLDTSIMDVLARLTRGDMAAYRALVRAAAEERATAKEG